MTLGAKISNLLARTKIACTIDAQNVMGLEGRRTGLSAPTILAAHAKNAHQINCRND